MANQISMNGLLETIKKNRIIQQFMSFGLIGLLNTVLSLAIYWICIYLGINYFWANAVAFVITVGLSYILNNILTFRKKGDKAVWSFKVLGKVYASYSISGILINSLLLWLWNDCIGVDARISPLLNLIVTVPLNFVMNKVWAYKNK